MVLLAQPDDETPMLRVPSVLLGSVQATLREAQRHSWEERAISPGSKRWQTLKDTSALPRTVCKHELAAYMDRLYNLPLWDASFDGYGCPQDDCMCAANKIDTEDRKSVV